MTNSIVGEGVQRHARARAIYRNSAKKLQLGRSTIQVEVTYVSQI